jgi:hypothetical protein
MMLMPLLAVSAERTIGKRYSAQELHENRKQEKEKRRNKDARLQAHDCNVRLLILLKQCREE